MELRICIDVDDMERAIAFYTGGLGLNRGAGRGFGGHAHGSGLCLRAFVPVGFRLRTHGHAPAAFLHFPARPLLWQILYEGPGGILGFPRRLRARTGDLAARINCGAAGRVIQRTNVSQLRPTMVSSLVLPFVFLWCLT